MGLSFLQSPGAAWEIYKQLIRLEQNEEESRKIQVASLCLLLTFVDRPEHGKLFLRFFVRSYFLVRTKATNFLLSILLRSSTCQLVSRSLLSFFLVFITTMSSKKFFKNGAHPINVEHDNFLNDSAKQETERPATWLPTPASCPSPKLKSKLSTASIIPIWIVLSSTVIICTTPSTSRCLFSSLRSILALQYIPSVAP